MISIIIPNHNGVENLKKNLPKVIEAMSNFDDESELIVVDDASIDNSAAFLTRFCSDNPRVVTTKIVNKINLGFGESCNIGVKNAKGEIVVLLNSDVYPDKNFIQPLVERFEDEKVFAVGCLEKNIDENGKEIEERGVGEIYFKNGIYQHRKGDLNSMTTDWVNGGSGAFRRDLYLELGGFDKRFYPFYWEDVDFSFRAKKSGYKLLFERKSVVYHQHVAGSIAQKYTRSEIENISFQNQLKFTKKHSNFYQKILFLLFLLKRSIFGAK